MQLYLTVDVQDFATSKEYCFVPNNLYCTVTVQKSGVLCFVVKEVIVNKTSLS